MIVVEYDPDMPSRMNLLHFFQLRRIVRSWHIAAKVSWGMQEKRRLRRLRIAKQLDADNARINYILRRPL